MHQAVSELSVFLSVSVCCERVCVCIIKRLRKKRTSLCLICLCVYIYACVSVCVCVCVFVPLRAPCPGLRLSDRVRANLSCMPQSPRLHPCPPTASVSVPPLSVSVSWPPLPPPPPPLSSFLSFLSLRSRSFPHLSFSLFWINCFVFSSVSPACSLFSFFLSFNACDHSAQPSHPHIFLIAEPLPAFLL